MSDLGFRLVKILGSSPLTGHSSPAVDAKTFGAIVGASSSTEEAREVVRQPGEEARVLKVAPVFTPEDLPKINRPWLYPYIAQNGYRETMLLDYGIEDDANHLSNPFMISRRIVNPCRLVSSPLKQKISEALEYIRQRPGFCYAIRLSANFAAAFALRCLGADVKMAMAVSSARLLADVILEERRKILTQVFSDISSPRTTKERIQNILPYAIASGISYIAMLVTGIKEAAILPFSLFGVLTTWDTFKFIHDNNQRKEAAWQLVGEDSNSLNSGNSKSTSGKPISNPLGALMQVTAPASLGCACRIQIWP